MKNQQAREGIGQKVYGSHSISNVDVSRKLIGI